MQGYTVQESGTTNTRKLQISAFGCGRNLKEMGRDYRDFQRHVAFLPVQEVL